MSDRFKMKAYTGRAVNSMFWGSIVFDVSGIQTEPKLPALLQHDPLLPAGVITRIFKDTSTLWAEGHFVTNTTGESVKDLLAQGYPYQASIGVFFDEVEQIDQGETASVNGGTFTGPGVIVRKSKVREISFVALGADDRTAAIAAAAGKPGSTTTRPADFGDAIYQVLFSEKLPPREAIATAARRYPDLYDGYLKKLYEDAKQF